ncbi:MAG: hypothetical protein JWQ87_2758 [Candidatus Sulfotelmatobacter sp.]|nr:hypothetical protein [Candidatus Sulfotelmatobacter sp.]
MHQPDTPVSRDAGDPRQFSSEQPARSWVSVLTLAILTAGAAALRFLFLARKPFWFDECFSVEVARLSWHDLVRLLWWREANMSLYYVLLRGWLHFGFNPFFVRSFSVLCSLAALPAIFWLGCKLFDRRVGLIAVALMSCNAYAIRYAQEARSYSLFLLLATLSSAFFVEWLQKPSRRNRSGYILASALAAYAHLYALLLVAAHWLSMRGEPARYSRARTTVPSSMRRAWVGIGLAVLPLLAFVVKTGAGPIRWIARLGFIDVFAFWEHLAGNNGWPLLLLYIAACLAAISPLRGRLLRIGPVWEVWRLQFLLIWLLFPIALTLVLSLARPIFLGRYFIFCLPALIVLAAAGLANLRKTWMMGICLAAMLLLSLQGTLSYYDHDFDLERDGSEAAANYIYDHARVDDAILFHIAEARIPYEFFGSLRTRNPGKAMTATPVIIFPRHGDHLDYRDVTGKPDMKLLRSAASNYGRVWVVLMSNETAGHPDATTLMLEQVLGGSFPRIERARFPQVEVRLYDK